jgi:hypothetical protein
MDTITELKRKLAGAWNLRRIDELDRSGRLITDHTALDVQRFTIHPRGRLMYSLSGAVSIQISHPRRPLLSTSDRVGVAPSEALAAYETYSAYYGHYELDAENQMITHVVESNLFPNGEGKRLVRGYRFEGSDLMLDHPPFEVNGEQRTRTLIWTRSE